MLKLDNIIIEIANKDISKMITKLIEILHLEHKYQLIFKMQTILKEK